MDKTQYWMLLDGTEKTICTTNGITIATELNAVDAQYIVDAHNAVLDRLDVSKPTKPSILDEEWTLHGSGDARSVKDNKGDYPNLRKHYREIAALPDAYRALVMVRDKDIRCEGDYKSIELTLADTIQITAVLKKAGIE